MISKYHEGALISAQYAADAMYEGVREHFSKHGEQYLDLRNWLAVIFEEAGEVAAAVNKGDFDNAIHEIGQTMACFARLRYEIERERDGIADAERDHYSQSV